MPASPVNVARTLECLALPGGSGALKLISVRPGGLESALGSLAQATAAFVRATGFAAEAGRVVLLPGAEGLEGALLGLGEDRSPWVHGGLATALPAGTTWELAAGDFDLQPIIGLRQFARTLGYLRLKKARLHTPFHLPSLQSGRHRVE